MKYFLIFFALIVKFISTSQVVEGAYTNDNNFESYSTQIDGVNYVVQAKIGNRDLFVRDTTTIYNDAGIYNSEEKCWVLEPKFEDIKVFSFQTQGPLAVFEDRFIYFATIYENETRKSYTAFSFNKEKKIRNFGNDTWYILVSGLLLDFETSEDEINLGNTNKQYFFNNQGKELDPSYACINVDNYTITAKKGNTTFLLDAQSFEILASGDSITKVQVFSEYDSFDETGESIEVAGFLDTEKPLYIVYENGKLRLFDYEHNKHFVGPFDVDTKVIIEDNHVDLPNFDFIYFEKPGANFIYLNGAENAILPYDSIQYFPFYCIHYKGESKIIDYRERKVVFCCNGLLNFSGKEFQVQETVWSIDPETGYEIEVASFSPIYSTDFLFKKTNGNIQLLSNKMKLSSQMFDSLYKTTGIFGVDAEENYRYIGVYKDGKKGIFDFNTGVDFFAENITYHFYEVREYSYFTGLINQKEYYFDGNGKISRNNNPELFNIKKEGKLVGVTENIDEDNDPFVWAIPAKYKAIEINYEYLYPLFNVQDPITKLWGVVDQNDRQITPLKYISAPEFQHIDHQSIGDLIMIGTYREGKNKVYDFGSIKKEHCLFTSDLKGVHEGDDPLFFVFHKTKKQNYGEQLFYTEAGLPFLFGDYYRYEYERRLFYPSVTTVHPIWTKLESDKKYYVNSWYDYNAYLTEEQKVWAPPFDSAACVFDMLFTDKNVGVRFVNTNLEQQKSNPESQYDLVDLFTNKTIARVNKLQLIHFWQADFEFKWENQEYINLNDEESYSNVWLESIENVVETEIRLMGIKKGEKKPMVLY